jgi:hypothetical protein
MGASFLVKVKSLAEFCRRSGKMIWMIFRRGVYLAENSSQTANVRAKRVRCSRLQAFSKNACIF